MRNFKVQHHSKGTSSPLILQKQAAKRRAIFFKQILTENKSKRIHKAVYNNGNDIEVEDDIELIETTE